MSVQNLYDFETPIEAAVAAALVAQGLTVNTQASAPAYQEARPRVDVVFQVGAGKRSIHICPDGKQREATFSGVLSLEVVTEDDTTHRAYRAKVRAVLAVIADTINDSLNYHHIQGVWASGTSNEIRWAEGYKTSKLQYAVDFGVDFAAWAELTN